jgi:hypothetical protein
MKTSIASEIKKLVYADPEATPASIHEKLSAAGILTTLQTISACRSDFLNSLAILNELEAFKKAAPIVETKKISKKKQSRSARWSTAASNAVSALEELLSIQEEFSEWKDKLPENLQSSTLGEKLEAVCDIDLQSTLDVASDADNAYLPLGFGRD